MKHPMLWAVRAVPVLVIFGAIDLMKGNLPTLFLVLTLVRLTVGVVVLWVMHKERHDKVGLAYIVFVFVTCLINPARGAELLVLAGLALVVIAGDQLWQRSKDRSSQRSAESTAPDGSL